MSEIDPRAEDEDDGVLLVVWYIPALTVGLLVWFGILGPPILPATTAVAATVGSIMYTLSAINSRESGFWGTAIAQGIGAVVLVAYTVVNALFVTNVISEATLSSGNRTLFPLLITSTIVGPSMFRRWRERRKNELLSAIGDLKLPEDS